MREVRRKTSHEHRDAAAGKGKRKREEHNTTHLVVHVLDDLFKHGAGDLGELDLAFPFHERVCAGGGREAREGSDGWREWCVRV